MCKHTDQFRRTQVDGIYKEPIPTHQQANKYQPPQVSICERYAASYYGGFESKGLTMYLKVGLRKAAHPAKNQLCAETVVLAVQQPTVLLLCSPTCGEASTGAGTKSPLTSSSSMVFLFHHIRVGKNYEGRTYNGSHVYVYRTDASTMFD
jgi:hypothetical protein